MSAADRAHLVALLAVRLSARREAARSRRVARDIFAYVEGFDNRTRRHSAIGYLSPIEMELKAA